MESTGLRGQRLGGETTGHALRVSMQVGGGRESLQVSGSMGDEDGGSRTKLLASGPARERLYTWGHSTKWGSGSLPGL